jgi:hypothetical protein
MSLVVLADYGCSDAIMKPIPSSCASSRGSLFSPNQSPTWETIGDYAINDGPVGLAASIHYQQNARYGVDTLGLGYLDITAGPALKDQVIGGIATASPFYMYGGTHPLAEEPR